MPRITRYECDGCEQPLSDPSGIFRDYICVTVYVNGRGKFAIVDEDKYRAGREVWAHNPSCLASAMLNLAKDVVGDMREIEYRAKRANESDYASPNLRTREQLLEVE